MDVVSGQRSCCVLGFLGVLRFDEPPPRLVESGGRSRPLVPPLASLSSDSGSTDVDGEPPGIPRPAGSVYPYP